MRLDQALAMLVDKNSRSFIQRLIKNGNVTVNEVVVCQPNFKVKANDLIKFKEYIETSVSLTKACDVKLDILFEDKDLIVINKPAGLTVHPGAGNHQDTLVNMLLAYTSSLSDLGGDDRPGIVHRLDKDTSGLMIVAKNNFAHCNIAKQLENRQLVRKYKALVWGVIKPLTGVITTQIGRSKSNRKKMAVVKLGGKHAVTHYNTEEVFLEGLLSLVECKLETGRTHQIRLHLSNKGNSIVGDQIYGDNNRKINSYILKLPPELILLKRQALHAWYIRFSHPVTDQVMEFATELPSTIAKCIKQIR